MSKRIITVSREFGSGGRTIGKMLAAQLKISYYDKELVKKVALETGFNEEYIEQQGEYASAKSKIAAAFNSWGGQGAVNGMSVDDFLWVMQRKIIM